MLFADGTPDAAALGTWMQVLFYVLGGVCAVVVAVVTVLSYLRKDPPKPDAEYVTRGEMTSQIGRIDSDIKELKTYVQMRMHDQANRLHAINLRIVWIMGLMTQLCGKQGIPIPAEPSISTSDEA